MHILKSRLTIFLGSVCLIAILLTLATSEWLAYFAMTHGITSVNTLANIQSTLNVLATVFAIICFLCGLFFLFLSPFLLVRRLIWKKGQYSQAGVSFLRAVVMICVSTIICSHHVFYNIPEPEQLGNSETFTLPGVVGKYHYGDGYVHFSVNINANGTYSYSHTGCEGLYENSSGTAKILNGYLVLSSDRVLKEGSGTWGAQRQYYKPDHPAIMKFVPVRWGDRLYLIPPNDMIGFAAAIYTGEEPRTGDPMQKIVRCNFFLRDGDWNKPVKGVPVLPIPWNVLQFTLSR